MLTYTNAMCVLMLDLKGMVQKNRKLTADVLSLFLKENVLPLGGWANTEQQTERQYARERSEAHDLEGGAFMSAELTWEWDVSQLVIWWTYGGL